MEGGDGAVTCRRAHEIDAFEAITEPEIRDASVSDAFLPGHLERAQIRQIAQHFESTIRQRATRILTQIQVLELRHARKPPQAVVGQLPRFAEIQRRDVFQLDDSPQKRVGHYAVRCEGGVLDLSTRADVESVAERLRGLPVEL